MRIQPLIEERILPGKKVSRRSFLKTGFSTVTALSMFPEKLFGRTGTNINLNSRYRMIPVGNVQRPIVIVWLEGGMSHIDSFCPLPEAQEDIRGPYGTIQTTQPGVRISSMLPLTAEHLNKMALMRNIKVNDPTSNHPTSTTYMFTGSNRTIGRDVNERAVHESFVTRFSGHFGQNNIGYVAFSTQPGFKTFYPGMAHADSLLIVQDQSEHDNSGNHPYPSPFQENTNPEIISRRNQLLRQINNFNVNSEQVNRWDRNVENANKILNGNFSRAFDLTRVPDRVRDMYGKTSFGNSALIAKRLVDEEAPFIIINNPGWDQHFKLKDESQYSLNSGLDYKLPEFDKVISALFTNLGDRAIIAIGTEFGRTPRINKDQGRDHWTKSGFLIIGGAGITPRVFGGINNSGEITGNDGIFLGEFMMPTIAKAAGYEFYEDRGGALSAEPIEYYPIF